MDTMGIIFINVYKHYETPSKFRKHRFICCRCIDDEMTDKLVFPLYLVVAVLPGEQVSTWSLCDHFKDADKHDSE